MFLEKLFHHGGKEQAVIELITRHIELLYSACLDIRRGLLHDDRKLIRQVFDLEREGDSIRREILSSVYEGAFLPYIRPNLCRFVETVDIVFDLIEEMAFDYLDLKLPETIQDDCLAVADLNVQICEMLKISFQAMTKGDDLREKALAVRIYEKRIDDIKFRLRKTIRRLPVSSFWEGRVLAEFVTRLTAISDVIEDASDYLQIISVSMR